MRAIALDTDVFVWCLSPETTDKAQRDLVRRGAELLEDIEARRDRVFIPSVVIGEVLVKVSDPVAQQVLAQRTARMQIAPYDTGAAAQCARLVRQHLGEYKSLGLLRQEFKVDMMILATALANRCAVLYTHDAVFSGLARQHIMVEQLPPLRPKQTVLPEVMKAPSAKAEGVATAQSTQSDDTPGKG